MSKSADAFRTISEVADWLGVQAHVLRFWESKFSQIKPVKRAGGRRYYRPADMLLLGGIQKLLHEDGLSIKEVQTILRDLGVGHVSQLSHDLEEDGPPAHRNATRATSKKSGGAGSKPAYASPDEPLAENSASLTENPPLDPAAAALLSTPATAKTDPSQEAAAQETPSEPADWQESSATPNPADAQAQPAASTEETMASVPAASAEMPDADLSVAEPEDQAGETSAGSESDLFAASNPAEHAAAEPVADTPVSPGPVSLDPASTGPAQMHMELDAPVAAAPEDTPEDTLGEQAAAASTPPQDDMSEGGMPDIMPDMEMPVADAAPVQEDAQPYDEQSAQPETAPADLAVSPPDDLETQPFAASNDPLASPEPVLSPVAEDPSAVSPLPAASSSEGFETGEAEPETPQPEDPSPEDLWSADPSPAAADGLAVESSDLAAQPDAAAPAESPEPESLEPASPEPVSPEPEPPEMAGINAAETPAQPDWSQSILSLLDQTTVLPTHIQADVANCAAELRALLAAR